MPESSVATGEGLTQIENDDVLCLIMAEHF